MIGFIDFTYSTYAYQVITDISDADSENNRFHWYRAEKDFVYEKIHLDVTKAFVASKK